MLPDYQRKTELAKENALIAFKEWGANNNLNLTPVELDALWEAYPSTPHFCWVGGEALNTQPESQFVNKKLQLRALFPAGRKPASLWVEPNIEVGDLLNVLDSQARFCAALAKSGLPFLAWAVSAELGVMLVLTALRVNDPANSSLRDVNSLVLAYRAGMSELMLNPVMTAFLATLPDVEVEDAVAYFLNKDDEGFLWESLLDGALPDNDNKLNLQLFHFSRLFRSAYSKADMEAQWEADPKRMLNLLPHSTSTVTQEVQKAETLDEAQRRFMMAFEMQDFSYEASDWPLLNQFRDVAMALNMQDLTYEIEGNDGEVHTIAPVEVLSNLLKECATKRVAEFVQYERAVYAEREVTLPDGFWYHHPESNEYVCVRPTGKVPVSKTAVTFEDGSPLSIVYVTLEALPTLIANNLVSNPDNIEAWLKRQDSQVTDVVLCQLLTNYLNDSKPQDSQPNFAESNVVANAFYEDESVTPLDEAQLDALIARFNDTGKKPTQFVIQPTTAAVKWLRKTIAKFSGEYSLSYETFKLTGDGNIAKRKDESGNQVEVTETKNEKVGFAGLLLEREWEVMFNKTLHANYHFDTIHWRSLFKWPQQPHFLLEVLQERYDELVDMRGLPVFSSDNARKHFAFLVIEAAKSTESIRLFADLIRNQPIKLLPSFSLKSRQTNWPFSVAIQKEQLAMTPFELRLSTRGLGFSFSVDNVPVGLDGTPEDILQSIIAGDLDGTLCGHGGDFSSDTPSNIAKVYDYGGFIKPSYSGTQLDALLYKKERGELVAEPHTQAKNKLLNFLMAILKAAPSDLLQSLNSSFDAFWTVACEVANGDDEMGLKSRFRGLDVMRQFYEANGVSFLLELNSVRSEYLTLRKAAKIILECEAKLLVMAEVRRLVASQQLLPISEFSKWLQYGSDTLDTKRLNPQLINELSEMLTKAKSVHSEWVKLLTPLRFGLTPKDYFFMRNLYELGAPKNPSEVGFLTFVAKNAHKLSKESADQRERKDRVFNAIVKNLPTLQLKSATRFGDWPSSLPIVLANYETVLKTYKLKS